MKDAQCADFKRSELSPFIAVDPFDRLVHEEGEGIEHVVVGNFAVLDVVAVEVVETSESCDGAV